MSSEHPKHQHESAAYVGAVKRSEGWLTKDVKKVIAAIVLIIVVLVGGYLFLHSRTSNEKTPEELQEERAYSAMVSIVKGYEDKGLEQPAASQLLSFNQQYLGKQTKPQQFYIANELGAIYRTMQDYKNAVLWQKRALEASPKPGFAEYDALGEAYLLEGDKANAIKYLKLALTEINNDKTNAPFDQQKNFITGEITSLGGS